MYDTIRRRRQLNKQLRHLKASRNRTTVIGRSQSRSRGGANNNNDNSSNKIFNMLLVQNQQLIMQQHNMMLMMINRCYNGTTDQATLQQQLPTTTTISNTNPATTTNDSHSQPIIDATNTTTSRNLDLGSMLQLATEQQPISNRGWITGTTLVAQQQQGQQVQQQQVQQIQQVQQQLPQAQQVQQQQQVQQIQQVQQVHHQQQVQQPHQTQQAQQVQQPQQPQQIQQASQQQQQVHQQQHLQPIQQVQQQQQIQQVQQQQLFEQLSNQVVSAHQHETHMQRSYLHTPAASEQDPMSDRPDDELLYADHQDENDTTLQHLSDALYNPGASLVYTPFKNDDFYAFKNISDFSSNSSECESLSTPRVDREPITQINPQNVAKNLSNQFKTPVKNSDQSGGVRTPGKLQQASDNLNNTTSPGGISIQIVPNGNNNMRDTKARIIQSMNITKFLRQVHPEASVDKQ